MERNKLYYAYKLFKDTIPIYPVYLLLFESKGLSLGQISLLFAIWSVPVVLLELPTGILADHWSRKNMIVTGSICKAACYVFWFFSEGFLLYAVGFIFWGISEALCSGSEEALLYDSLKQRREERCFDKVYGTGNFCSGLGVAFSCFAGGALTEAVTFRGVLAASALMALLSTIFALKFKEVNYYREGMESKAKEDCHKPLDTLAGSLDLCIRNRLLMLVILMLVVVAGVAGILDEYDSLVADSFELRLGLMHNLYGIIFFMAVSAVSGLGIRWILILSGAYVVCLSLLLFIRYRSVKGPVLERSLNA